MEEALGSKKSFVLYNDWHSVFEKLSDEEAGKLIKHIFLYNNGLAGDLEDRLLEITFEPIRLQLDRDFDKWLKTTEVRREAGRIGGLKSGEVRKQNEANEANA